MTHILDSAWRALGVGKQSSEPMAAAETSDIRRPLLTLSPRQSFGPPPPRGVYYGTTMADSRGRAHEYSTASRSGSYLDRVVEEPEDIDDEEVFPGTYTRAVAIYSSIPFVLALVFLLLALVPHYASRQLSLPRAHPPLLPHPLPSLLIPTTFYALSHLLRAPTYTLLASLFPRRPALVPFLSTTLHVALHTLLRLLSIPLLLSTAPALTLPLGYPSHRHHHPSVTFTLVWFLALGWALAEVSAGVAQGYTQLALYRDVFSAPSFSSGRGTETPTTEAERFQAETDPLSLSGIISRDYATPTRATPSPMAALEDDLERLVALNGREELEELYGVPLINIPIFIQLLQRLAALLLSLGLTLVLSSAYLRWLGSFPPGSDLSLMATTKWMVTQPASHDALLIALPITFGTHLILAIIHTPPVLAYMGAHAAAYVGSVVGLGAFFAGLGMWEILD